MQEKGGYTQWKKQYFQNNMNEYDVLKYIII